jgi:hypothetical protein
MNADVEVWQPEFEGQRPPFQRGNTLGFQPGHTLSLKHGAKSPRIQGERAAAVWAELTEDGLPIWMSEVDRFQLESFVFAYGQVRGLREWLAERPPAQPNGKSWPVEDSLHKWERRLQMYIDRLGFNPVERARLGRDTAIAQSSVAASVAALEARGAAAQARYEGGAT